MVDLQDNRSNGGRTVSGIIQKRQTGGKQEDAHEREGLSQTS